MLSKETLERLVKAYEQGFYERSSGFNKNFFMNYVCSICKELIKEEAIVIKYNRFWNFYFHENCLKKF